ncbi:winged helix-turn-helix transcriptional regulator [Pseudomonas granadensis]|uniref:winged helix-turn-helix domain-containing protein n=1 Tax=Pseudomonas granadensis TaxID=1421430 RepID=UPI0019D25E7B|nr:winged helix-turn-helix domain-containing protein [Pseudomonas granadensis]MBN6776265.1 winged helix-turn-helix transcriptional regulator [Pseudomonas granadensis]MBN6807283.1 winged helix-turn-helix transcriptional regulator [Pseudomonas granadensis]MBN6834125.1 winged helix-turn-helix transcriptional regulator [Pseudomonas granadensis]MBN6841658.1 winged helix-turn-helix transcriptional regulator [Pseudomonas granadensis]MBN6870313.1 winged helix-turn-helix transcriptional regulator [Pseu
MLSANLATRSPRPTNNEPGVLTLGRTRGVAEHFRTLIAQHVRSDMVLEASAYASSYNFNEHVGSYRAIFLIIDSPQALEDNLALVENLRSDNLKPIICAVITGRGAFNKIKYYLAGADICIKLNTLSDDGAELLAEFFSSEEWQRDINLTLDPTRICLVDKSKKLDISFAEMKILEAFAQTGNHILSHDEIAGIMGLNTNFYDPRALEKSISRLRGKIKDMYGTNAIQSIRGYGYRLLRGLISTA